MSFEEFGGLTEYYALAFTRASYKGACPTCKGRMSLPPRIVDFAPDIIRYTARDTIYYTGLPLLEKISDLASDLNLTLVAHVVMLIYGDGADGVYEIPQGCPAEASVTYDGIKVHQRSYDAGGTVYSHDLFTKESLDASKLGYVIKESFPFCDTPSIVYAYVIIAANQTYKLSDGLSISTDVAIESRYLNPQSEGINMSDNVVMTKKFWKEYDALVTSTSMYGESQTKKMIMSVGELVTKHTTFPEKRPILLANAIEKSWRPPTQLVRVSTFISSLRAWVRENPITALATAGVIGGLTLYLYKKYGPTKWYYQEVEEVKGGFKTE